jgi:hypothetical protein
MSGVTPRKPNRLRRRFEIRYGEPGGERFTGYSGNISGQGIMVRTARVFGEGVLLDLELKLPHGSIHLKGRVRWARQGNVQLLSSGRIGMGISLVNPPADLLASLDARIAKP